MTLTDKSTCATFCASVVTSKPVHCFARVATSIFKPVVMGRSSYQKVFDDRKRRIRGLWKRNNHFYARLVIVDEATGHKASGPECSRSASHTSLRPRPWVIWA